MSIAVPSLEELVTRTSRLESVRKMDVQAGDFILVRTRNSVYRILVLGHGQYAISGGWFDRHFRSPQVHTINGCTWGGSAIKQDLLAARGLFLEFGNLVTTTRIQDVRIVRSRDQMIH